MHHAVALLTGLSLEEAHSQQMRALLQLGLRAGKRRLPGELQLARATITESPVLAQVQGKNAADAATRFWR